MDENKEDVQLYVVENVLEIYVMLEDKEDLD